MRPQHRTKTQIRGDSIILQAYNHIRENGPVTARVLCDLTGCGIQTVGSPQVMRFNEYMRENKLPHLFSVTQGRGGKGGIKVTWSIRERNNSEQTKEEMKYKITITKIETVQSTEQGDYTIIDRRPWTKKELDEEKSHAYGDGKTFLEKNPLKEIRGYAPARSIEKAVETEVLKQTVETLDLSAVIRAVNGL